MSTPFDVAEGTHVLNGVDVTAVPALDGMLYIDRAHEYKAAAPLVNALEQFGFRRGKTVFGATYDWRLGPVEWMRDGGEYTMLKNLVEMAFRLNDNTKVMLLSASMGSAYTMTFLTRFVKPDWKAKYIHRFVSVSGVFNGAPDYIRMSTCGYDISDGRMPWISPLRYAKVVRTWASTAWMLPAVSSEPIVEWLPANRSVGCSKCPEAGHICFDLPEHDALRWSRGHTCPDLQAACKDHQFGKMFHQLCPQSCRNQCVVCQDASRELLHEATHNQLDSCSVVLAQQLCTQEANGRLFGMLCPQSCGLCGNSKYTAATLADFLGATGQPEVAAMFEQTRDKYYQHLSPPGVVMECLYSSGLPTVVGVRVSGRRDPNLRCYGQYGDGDGTAPKDSVQRCRAWAEKDSDVVVTEFRGIRHKELLSHPQVMQKVIMIATGHESLLSQAIVYISMTTGQEYIMSQMILLIAVGALSLVSSVVCFLMCQHRRCVRQSRIEDTLQFHVGECESDSCSDNNHIIGEDYAS